MKTGPFFLKSSASIFHLNNNPYFETQRHLCGNELHQKIFARAARAQKAVDTMVYSPVVFFLEIKRKSDRYIRFLAQQFFQMRRQYSEQLNSIKSCQKMKGTEWLVLLSLEGLLQKSLQWQMVVKSVPSGARLPRPSCPPHHLVTHSRLSSCRRALGCALPHLYSGWCLFPPRSKVVRTKWMCAEACNGSALQLLGCRIADPTLFVVSTA